MLKVSPVTVINPVEKLLAHGRYLESSVDIAESTRHIAVAAIPTDHILLMAGFIAGHDKGELVMLGAMAPTIPPPCWLLACAPMVVKSGLMSMVFILATRTVPDAKLLKSMSYQEAMELSYFGAKVLHPRTIAPIAQFQIPCLIKNTANPQAPDTLIGEESRDENMPMKEGCRQPE